MEPPLSQEAVVAQDDGPLWYSQGAPFGLEVLPGTSGAGRGLEAKKYIYNTGATVNLSSGRDNAARSRFGCFFALRSPIRFSVRRMVPRDSEKPTQHGTNQRGHRAFTVEGEL